MVGAMSNNLMLSTITGGAILLLTYHPLHRNQLWMDPIPESLTRNRRTDGGITEDLGKDPGKAGEIMVPIRMENVVESRNKTDADGTIAITATIVTVQIVMSVRKLGRLMVSQLL